MNRLYNYHTHTRFSDGSDHPEAYINEALKQNFSSLGFSEHSVLPFENSFALQPGNEQAYIDEIERLRLEYRDRLQIYTAFEADFVPGISEGFRTLKQQFNLDYLIGSVHLVKSPHEGKLWFIDGSRRETYDQGLNELFEGNIRKGVTAYWHQVNKMIENEEFDIIGHLDKIKMHNQGRWFSEDDKWYISLVNETIELIASKKLIVEINTRGIYKGRSQSLFPGEYIIRQLRQNNIPVVISSDAHQPVEISKLFEMARIELQRCGYRSVAWFTDSGWTELPLN